MCFALSALWGKKRTQNICCRVGFNFYKRKRLRKLDRFTCSDEVSNGLAFLCQNNNAQKLLLEKSIHGPILSTWGIKLETWFWFFSDLSIFRKTIYNSYLSQSHGFVTWRHSQTNVNCITFLSHAQLIKKLLKFNHTI